MFTNLPYKHAFAAAPYSKRCEERKWRRAFFSWYSRPQCRFWWSVGYFTVSEVFSASLQMPQSACLLNCWTVNCFVFHSKSLLQSEVCNKNNMLSWVNNLFLQTLLRCVELMAHSEENMHDKSTHILSHTVVSLINRPIIKSNYSFCASTQAFKANS